MKTSNFTHSSDHNPGLGRIRSLSFALCSSLISAFLLSGIHTAMADTIPVTGMVDGTLVALAGNGTCDFREALEAANTDSMVDACPMGNGPDVVDLTGLTGVITIDAAAGEPLVTSDIVFNGPGSDILALSGGDLTRILNIEVFDPVHVTVEINDLAFINGNDATRPGIWGAGIRHHEETPGIGSLTINRCLFRDNNLLSEGSGGALNSNVNTVINDSVFTNNRAGAQAGAMQLQNAAFTINNTTVINNTTGGNTNRPVYGGGIFVIQAINPTSLVMNNSTVSGNSAVGGLGGGVGAQGADVEINNSTISGNTGAAAGGIVNSSFDPAIPGTMTINNSTVANNTTTGGPGAGVITFGNEATFITSVAFYNTILSNNGDDCFAFGGGSTYDATAGYNIDSNGDGDDFCIASGGPGNLNLDPLLNPLANNGGPTQTHSIPVFSPAFNMGDPLYAGPLSTDQRGSGFARIANGGLDIGAFELQYENLPAIPVMSKTGLILVALLLLIFGLAGIRQTRGL